MSSSLNELSFFMIVTLSNLGDHNIISESGNSSMT